MRNEDGYKACVTFILGGCGALSLYAKEYEKAGLKPNVFDSIEAFEKMYLG